MSRASTSLLFAAAAAALLASAASASASASADSSGRVVVRGVSTTGYPTLRVAAVVPRAGSTVPALFEDGLRAPSVDAQNLGTNKAVLLAIDRSASMKGRPLGQAVEAAREFLATKPDSDAVGVAAFSSSALMLTDNFATSTIDADAALRTFAVDKRKGTSLYDVVSLGAAALARAPESAKVMVLLTDGADVGSSTTLADAVAAARRDGVLVYTIGIGNAKTGILSKIARTTGGRAYYAPSPRTLGRVYRSITAELRRTWLLSYATRARPGDSVRLVVRYPSAQSGSLERKLPGRDPSPPQPLLPSRVVGSPVTVAVVVLLAAILLAAALRIAFRRDREDWLRERIGTPTIDRPEPRRGSIAGLTGALGSSSKALDRSFGRSAVAKRAGLLLARAGSDRGATELILAAIIAALLLAAVAGFATGSLLVSAICFLVGGAAPFLVVSVKARRRINRFNDQLPDALSSIAATLRVGHSLRQAAQSIADTSNPPLRDEFARAVAATHFGVPLEDALAEMARRIDSSDLDYVVTAIAVQSQVGGALAGLFETVAETVRARHRHARKVASLTAMGRMSALVLVALPFVLGGLLLAVNPSYLKPLFDLSVGHWLIGYALVSMAFGSVLLRRIVAIRG